MKLKNEWLKTAIQLKETHHRIDEFISLEIAKDYLSVWQKPHTYIIVRNQKDKINKIEKI